MFSGLAGCQAPTGTTPAPSSSTPTSATTTSSSPPVLWIDTHAHPFGEHKCLDVACLTTYELTMDQYHVQHSLLLAQPNHRSPQSGGEDELVRGVMARPQRYSFILGGQSLNPIIHNGTGSGPEGTAFVKRADAIAANGSRGYGEMAALHLSFGAEHPFMEVPPDHPYFRQLAEKAAEHNLPIDFHMEAVVNDMDTPQRSRDMSAKNPPTLKANIAAFEQLLDHDPNARIVWAHVGWDNTGDMTTDLIRDLLYQHPNLYLQLKFTSTKFTPTFPDHSVLDSAKKIRPEWLTLLQDYPDRAVIGSDVKFADPEFNSAYLEDADRFVQALPSSIQNKIAFENAKALYNL
ncbi:MAG TPA: amidohydrolase family protein [Candidatus Thermoplasmatota archaeon]|nr:amidohydrolase family protein [Candidatus Thermoplasmatota archaeon]